MNFIYNKIFLEHDTGIHPENKERLLCFKNIEESQIESGEKYLTLYHTKEYIDKVKNAFRNKIMIDQETPMSEKSYEAACMAVGASILASKTNGFALIRPPGHHAYPDHASGFCIFNNIGITVQKLVSEGKKVFILDIDGHCGDGTEYFFYNSNRVLYMSLHSFPAFPMKGRAEEIGEGIGRGFTINITLADGTGDEVYLDAVNSFLPAVKQFNPDVVGISAGFDAYRLDPLLNLNLSLNAYYEIGKILSGNFKNIFAVLEGGYNTAFIPKCAQNLLDGINGKTQSHKEKRTQSSTEAVLNAKSMTVHLKSLLSNYWKL